MPIDMILSFTNIHTYRMSIIDTGIRELERTECISGAQRTIFVALALLLARMPAEAQGIAKPLFPDTLTSSIGPSASKMHAP